MSSPIISIESLGKRYTIRHQASRRPRGYLRLSEELVDAARAAFHSSDQQTSEEFWALRNVSLEIREGEVLGVIGRNGAGKTTLLKILSRITEPTEGRVRIRGRVASLLEVGTGFHPELTGRENIYLNGAILGMTRIEIRKRFDEIVAFAEVEKFLDTPVKRYSSGMYVRLAFAVAAHLDPEILVVDEVLAVGDAEFQKKCLGKMREVSTGGRTVLFVSHQMAAVQNLCQTGLLLAQGQVVQIGPIGEVVNRYLTESANLAELPLDERPDRQGTGALRFKGVSFKDDSGSPVRSFTSGSPAVIELVVSNPGQGVLHSVRISIGIDNEMGQRILVLSTNLAGADFPELPLGTCLVHVRIPRMTLSQGRYGFTLFASVNGDVADWVVGAGRLDVEGGDFYGSGQLPPAGRGWGFMLIDHMFELGSYRESRRQNPAPVDFHSRVT